MSPLLRSLLFLSLLLGTPGCRPLSVSNSPAGPVSATPGPFAFTEATHEAGIRFIHANGATGRHFLPETVAGGCAFLDYDADGDLDLLLTQGRPLPETPGDVAPHAALYRNRGDGTFVDATEGSGLEAPVYSLGAAAGDYDNDGLPDLFLTALGGNRLFHNEGHGKFRDITERAGVRGRDLSTGAAWLDYDGDGGLDLFICRYTDYAFAGERVCRDALGRPVYCAPHVYPETASQLYHNEGGGRFRDTTRESGIGAATGRAFGVACADFDEDGRTDLYVACDQSPNLLFLNGPGGRFREAATLAGVSHGPTGEALAGMGAETGDYMNDGHLGLVVTNFENEPVSLYRNRGKALFSDESYPSGIGHPTLPYLAWGCGLADFDLDGRLDLFVANGHVYEEEDQRTRKVGQAQPCLLFRNEGSGLFSDVSARSGAFFARRQVGRGAAFGDWDNDGDPDVLLACNTGPAVLLRNDTPHP